jgi:hypothetical protein
MMEEREEEEAHGTAEKPMIMDELKGERVEKSYCFSFCFFFVLERQRKMQMYMYQI